MLLDGRNRQPLVRILGEHATDQIRQETVDLVGYDHFASADVVK